MQGVAQSAAIFCIQVLEVSLLFQQLLAIDPDLLSIRGGESHGV
jgi:hypothetical protein